MAYVTGLDASNSQQAAQLANALQYLQIQQQQNNTTNTNAAQSAMAGYLANMPGAPGAPGAAPPVTGTLPGQAPSQAPMPPGAAPQGPLPALPGGTPTGVPPIPISAVTPGGAPPIGKMPNVPMPPSPTQLPPSGNAPAGPPTPPAGAPPQDPMKWIHDLAVGIKQQNPNLTGPQLWQAISGLTEVMNPANKQAMANLEIQLKQQQEMERQRHDQATEANQGNRTTIYQEIADTNRAKATGSGGQPVSESTISFLAEEVKAGNQSVLTRMPASVRLAVMSKVNESESGADAAGSTIDYKSKGAEGSSAGRQVGGIVVAGEGFKAIAPDAIAASNAVPRSSWKMAASAGNWLREQSSDPAFVKFQDYNGGLVREYARAFGGTVAAQTRAENLLGTAKDQAAYKVAVQTLESEIDKAAQGGKKAMSDISGSVGNAGQAPGISGSPAPDGTPPPPPGFVVQ